MACRGCDRRRIFCGWTCHRAGFHCRCLDLAAGKVWYPRDRPSEPVVVVSHVNDRVVFRPLHGEGRSTLSVLEFEGLHRFEKPTRWDLLAEPDHSQASKSSIE